MRTRRLRTVSFLGALLAAALCAACSTSAVTPAAREKSLGCEDAYSIDTPLGRIANNVWNRQAVGAYPFRQCILMRDAHGGAQYGWSWDAPPAGATLISFPQIVLGWKPWTGGTSSHPELPIRVSDLAQLRLAYAAETRATGKYSLAATLWMTRTGAIGAAPNPMDIATDIAIWTDGFAFDPFGAQVGHASIDGIDFEVWFARDLGDSTAAGPRWNYVAYRATRGSQVIALDLKKILDHAVAAGFISPEHYVSDVEIGNEIMSGSGVTWIKTLSFEVVRR